MFYSGTTTESEHWIFLNLYQTQDVTGSLSKLVYFLAIKIEGKDSAILSEGVGGNQISDIFSCLILCQSLILCQ